jgi:hypothetical protein
MFPDARVDAHSDDFPSEKDHKKKEGRVIPTSLPEHQHGSLLASQLSYE